MQIEKVVAKEIKKSKINVLVFKLEMSDVFIAINTDKECFSVNTVRSLKNATLIDHSFKET